MSDSAKDTLCAFKDCGQPSFHERHDVEECEREGCKADRLSCHKFVEPTVATFERMKRWAQDDETRAYGFDQKMWKAHRADVFSLCDEIERLRAERDAFKRQLDSINAWQALERHKTTCPAKSARDCDVHLELQKRIEAFL